MIYDYVKNYIITCNAHPSGLALSKTFMSQSFTMEVMVRDYLPGDAKGLVSAYRDAFNSLRKSRGGPFADSYVNGRVSRPDGQILSVLLHGSIVIVAQVKGTGEIIGMGSIANRWKYRLVGSTYGRNLLVKERYQKGRAGVSVGSLLRKATLDKARQLGFRKLYGYCEPGVMGFHERFGARPVPSQKIDVGGVHLQYYEMELRDSFWNRFLIEPHLAGLFGLSRLFSSIPRISRPKGKRSKNYSIERANEDDRPAVMEVLRTANMHHIPSKEMPSLDLDRCFVARIDSRIVGVGGYKMLSPTKGKTTVLVVDPQCRGLGIGKALQERRMDEMISLGAEKIITNADLPESIGWYKKNFGYRIIGKLKKHHEFGNPVISHWTTLELDVKERRHESKRSI